MSVMAISGSDSAVIASLQRQLLADQRTLASDQAARAARQVIMLDQALVTLDSSQIAAVTQAAGRQHVDLYT